jgi:hypothetical protein
MKKFTLWIIILILALAAGRSDKSMQADNFQNNLFV